MNLVMQGISLVGAALVLGAFAALQGRRWTMHDSPYLWANFVGATLLTIVGIWDRRLGFIVLEAAWAAVALASILRAPRGA